MGKCRLLLASIQAKKKKENSFHFEVMINNQKKNMLWHAKTVRNSNFCATNKISLEPSHPYSFIYCLWLLLCWVLQVALVVRNPPANVGDIRDVGSVSGSGRSPGEGHGNPLQYFCLENPMNRGAWWATVHGEAKESDTTEMTASTYSGVHAKMAEMSNYNGPHRAWKVRIIYHLPLCKKMLTDPYTITKALAKSSHS